MVKKTGKQMEDVTVGGRILRLDVRQDYRGRSISKVRKPIAGSGLVARSALLGRG